MPLEDDHLEYFKFGRSINLDDSYTSSKSLGIFLFRVLHRYGNMVKVRVFSINSSKRQIILEWEDAT